ncbi:hypothetical protein HEP87_40305 [Streptomyces sp. S1D4-11]|nr:hypothetical protein [Streptomyces sp. S1D4-11]QIY99057.1 hypothetical protein HEP87_40305 [Streptomyces sp. S1D4-11]
MAQPMGDTDYVMGGAARSRILRTAPRIAALVHAALGDARTKNAMVRAGQSSEKAAMI